MMLTNVRTPTHNRGDIEAMIAACELGKRRFLDLMRRYGKETVLGAAGDWLDYSERMLRQRDRQGPGRRLRGARSATSTTTARTAGKLLPVKVKVIIEGDSLTIDVTGSSDEVETAFNSPYEGAVRQRGDVHRAHDLPRRGDLRRLRAAERGHAAAGPRDRPEGLDLQPAASRARRRRASARCSGWPTSPCRRSRP